MQLVCDMRTIRPPERVVFAFPVRNWGAKYRKSVGRYSGFWDRYDRVRGWVSGIVRGSIAGEAVVGSIGGGRGS